MAHKGKRKEDTVKTRVWTRSDRLFEQGGNWFFYTREGSVEGPFGNRTKAVERIEIYVNLMASGMSPKTGDGPSLDLEPR